MSKGAAGHACCNASARVNLSTAAGRPRRFMATDYIGNPGGLGFLPIRRYSLRPDVLEWAIMEPVLMDHLLTCFSDTDAPGSFCPMMLPDDQTSLFAEEPAPPSLP